MKKYLSLIGVILFILILLNIDTGETWKYFSNLNPYLLIFVVLINIAIVGLRSLRWTKLLEMQGHNISFKKAFIAYFQSLYFGNITPARVGELSRAHFLMKNIKTNSATAVSSVVFDRVLDMYFMLILGIVGFLLSNIWSNHLWVQAFFITLIFLIPVLICCPNVTLTLIKVLPNYWQLRDRTSNWFKTFFDGIKCFLAPKVWFSVVLTAIIYLLFFVQCLYLAYSIDLKINFFYLTFCIVVFSILTLLPISISGMGTREFVLIFMFKYVNISSEMAVCYSILFFIAINLVLAVLGWAAYTFYTDKKLLSMKQTCK